MLLCLAPETDGSSLFVWVWRVQPHLSFRNAICSFEGEGASYVDVWKSVDSNANWLRLKLNGWRFGARRAKRHGNE